MEHQSTGSFTFESTTKQYNASALDKVVIEVKYAQTGSHLSESARNNEEKQKFEACRRVTTQVFFRTHYTLKKKQDDCELLSMASCYFKIKQFFNQENYELFIIMNHARFIPVRFGECFVGDFADRPSRFCAFVEKTYNFISV